MSSQALHIYILDKLKLYAYLDYLIIHAILKLSCHIRPTVRNKPCFTAKSPMNLKQHPNEASVISSEKAVHDFKGIFHPIIKSLS